MEPMIDKLVENLRYQGNKHLSYIIMLNNPRIVNGVLYDLDGFYPIEPLTDSLKDLINKINDKMLSIYPHLKEKRINEYNPVTNNTFNYFPLNENRRKIIRDIISSHDFGYNPFMKDRLLKQLDETTAIFVSK